MLSTPAHGPPKGERSQRSRARARSVSDKGTFSGSVVGSREALGLEEGPAAAGEAVGRRTGPGTPWLEPPRSSVLSPRKLEGRNGGLPTEQSDGLGRCIHPAPAGSAPHTHPHADLGHLTAAQSSEAALALSHTRCRPKGAKGAELIAVRRSSGWLHLPCRLCTILLGSTLKARQALRLHHCKQPSNVKNPEKPH